MGYFMEGEGEGGVRGRGGTKRTALRGWGRGKGKREGTYFHLFHDQSSLNVQPKTFA